MRANRAVYILGNDIKLLTDVKTIRDSSTSSVEDLLMYPHHSQKSTTTIISQIHLSSLGERTT